MPIKLATIRVRHFQEIARLEANREGQDFVIRLVYSKFGLSFRSKLDELDVGKVRLMMNGALCLEKSGKERKEFAELDELVARLTGGEASLLYDPPGIERGQELKRRIAMDQPHTVQFSELIDIVQQSSQIG